MQISEYAGVVKIANRYWAAHFSDCGKKYISREACDLKAAQRTAAIFSMNKQIKYKPEPVDLERPIVTIFKNGFICYPIQINADSVQCFIDLSGVFKDVLAIAQKFAYENNYDCVPLLDIKIY